MSIRADINKDDKKETLDACADMIEDYNKSNKDQLSEIEKLKLADVFGVDEDDD